MTAQNSNIVSKIVSTCRIVKDFPKSGINFIDISPIFENINLYGDIIKSYADILQNTQTNKILGIESRGFLLASPLAIQNNLPLILARKAGKVPYKPIKQEYGLEYGHSAIEISESQLNNNDRIAIVDDILATGGTIEAAIKIIQKAGAKVSCIIVLGDLADLDHNKILSKYNIPIKSLVQF